MVINKPTYLIAELAGDVVQLVNECRKKFNPDHMPWPVDITIAGSSGIGTIVEEQNLENIIKLIEPEILTFGFKNVSFKSIDRFANTGIYHLVPEREKFDLLHNSIAKSGIKFNENQWPYNPHCTLRAGHKPTEECDLLFKSTKIPKNVTIECFSLYQPILNGGTRIHKFL